MEKEKLKKILVLHAEWVADNEKGERANLIGADLRGANLIGANLIGANLIGANLIGANLIGANLIGANLRDADLSDADLSDANLRGADLSDADLSGANLRHADLSGANLRDANLRHADLSGAKSIFQCGPMPTSGRIVIFTWHGTEIGWMAYAGCFSGNLDELEAAVRKKHNCQVYLGVIEMLRKWNPED